MNYVYFSCVAGFVIMVFLVLVHRQRRSLERERLIKGLLDQLDGLEAQIQDYKDRMLALKGLLTRLPPDMTATAMHSVDAEAQAQHALREVLSHRLWIQREGAQASPQDLQNAIASLERSRQGLKGHLQALEQVATQLQDAGHGLRAAYQQLNPKVPE